MITLTDEIHGLGPTHQSKLASAEVRNSESLLKFCRRRSGRQQLSRQTGIPEETLRRWTVQAELSRIPGLDSKAAYLLQRLGIDCFDTLKAWDPQELLQRLAAENESQGTIPVLPTLERVESWIADAGILTPKATA